MPTSKRDAMKRKHTAVSNALVRCMGWTMELHDIYLQYHPDYAEGYLNITIMLEQSRVFIEKMRDFV